MKATFQQYVSLRASLFIIFIFSRYPLDAESIRMTHWDSVILFINQLQENSNYLASIPVCIDLIKQTAGLTDSVGIQNNITAQLFLIEAYRDAHLDSLYENKVIELRNTIPKNKPLEEYTNNDVFKEYAIMIFYADLMKLRKRYNEAIAELNKSIQFILRHPKFYDAVDNKNHRLYQSYVRLSSIAVSEANYALAQKHLEMALTYARLSDKNLEMAKNRPQGHEEKCLIEALNLAEKSKNKHFIAYYQKAYNAVKKSGAYVQIRDKDYSNALLQKDSLPLEFGLQLIIGINNNKLASSDLSIQFKIIEFYLRHDLINESKSLIDKLKSKLYHDNHKAAWFLADAGYKNSINDFSAMTSGIDSSLHYLKKNKSNRDIWQDQGLRTQLLETVQAGIIYHNNAYEQCRDNEYLTKKVNLILEFMTGLTSIRNDLIADEDRLGLIQRLTPVIDLALKTFSQAPQYQASHFDLILACFEAGKAFNLLTISNLKRQFNDFDKKRYNHLIAEKQNLQPQLDQEGANVDSLQHLLMRNQSQLSEIAANYAAQNKFQFNTIRDVQDQLDKHTSVLEYYKGPNTIYVLVINKNESRLYSFHTVDSSFKQDLANLKVSILMANQSEYRDLRDSLYRTAAWQLYQALLEPIESEIRERVIIVPDPMLSQIPFAALLTQPTNLSNSGNWAYWIHKHVICTQYSISLWMKEHGVEEKKSLYQKALISFAPHFEDLKYNQSECIELSNFMGNTTEFLGTEANEKNFKHYAPQGRILHLASHAKSDEIHQDRSFIQLDEDTLFGGEIGVMNLPHAMVFLGACETGTGKIVSGEGMMSLARSFFQAGAESVISTLWAIEDGISKGQVIEFYKYIKQGKSKDEAIHDMQINYLLHAKPGEEFPAYWAAYQTQGMLDPLYAHPLQATFYFLGLVPILTFAIGSIIYFWYRKKENLRFAA